MDTPKDALPKAARAVGPQSRVLSDHAFNEEGFDSLDPDYRRPKEMTSAQRARGEA